MLLCRSQAMWIHFRPSATMRPQQSNDRRQIDDLENSSQRSDSVQESMGSTQNAPVPGATNDGLGPLPSGWQMSKTENGRFFFIDHINKRTTWVKIFNRHRSKWNASSLY
jgi:hypothetical protein